MPFDARLISDNGLEDDDVLRSEATDLELPPELADLASQLSDDANHLAGLFPPNREAKPEVTVPASSGSDGKRIWISASLTLALLLVAIPATGLLVHQFRGTPGDAMSGDTRLGSIARTVEETADRETETTEDLSRTDMSRVAVHRGGNELPAPNTFDRRITNQLAPDQPRPVKFSVEQPIESLSPAILLQDASGPEIEGLLDLLEGQGDEKISLSI